MRESRYFGFVGMLTKQFFRKHVPVGLGRIRSEEMRERAHAISGYLSEEMFVRRDERVNHMLFRASGFG